MGKPSTKNYKKFPRVTEADRQYFREFARVRNQVRPELGPANSLKEAVKRMDAINAALGIDPGSISDRCWTDEVSHLSLLKAVRKKIDRDAIGAGSANGDK